MRKHLIHREFTSDIYKLVSIPYYDKISFNALPKRNVDYFDFEKYEDFDSLEVNVIESHNGLNLAEVKSLKCTILKSYTEIVEYIKD